MNNKNTISKTYGITYQVDKDMKILDCNRDFVIFTGFEDAKEIIGKNLSDIPLFRIHPEFIENHSSDIKKLIDSAVVNSREECFPSLNGDDHIFISHKSPVIKNGEVLGISILLVSKEGILLEEKAVLDNILNHIKANIYWKDLEGVYQGCNNNQAKSLGLNSGEDVVGKTDFELKWDTETAKEFRKNDLEIVRKKSSITREEKAIYGKHSKTLLSLKAPLTKSESIIGVLGISIDITELKEAQEKTQEALSFAEEAERRRRQFLSNQEHDINTSLAGVIYAGSMFQNEDMLRSMGGADVNSKMIVKCANRLQAYNRSLLKDLSWLDGEGKLIERRANIRETLSKLYDINVLAAKSKGCELEIFEIGDSIPEYLMIDDIALFQCLQDLLTNAINFTLDGKITVGVKLLKSEEGRVIAFHVRDTGRGIALKHQRYVFEDYYKILPSNQPDQITGQQADEDKGRGLGLAISQKKAQAMGGELHLEWSEEGSGSEFVLTLPLKTALNQGG